VRLPRRKNRQEAADAESDSESVTLIQPSRGKPRVGRFNLDNSSKKPIAIVNPHTGKMMIFTPQRPGGRGLDLSPEQFEYFNFLDTEPQTSPMVNPGNMMMSAMMSDSTFASIFNSTQPFGPEEAFFQPAAPLHAFGQDLFGDYSAEEEEDLDEDKLAIDDFVTFGDEFGPFSDDEKDLGMDEAEDPILCTPGTPARPMTASSDVTSLLDHFESNSDLVGAFRRDQANHQLISRSKATRESLAFSSPYYEGTLRGIKNGRIPTANVPISPLRKQRKMSDVASSPLATVSQKRKASSEQQWGHKRQRSIPDVNLLSI